MLNLHVNPCCSFFILYSFYVAPFIVLYFFTLHLYSFHVVLSSCYTLFVLHFLRVELFHVALFRCCTFFHVTDLSGYPVPIFSYYIFFILYSFHVALFSVLHSFHIAPSFVMHCSNFFVFFFFYVCCFMLHPILILQFCQVALSSCFIYLSIIFHIEAFLNLNFFCVALMSHLFSWCTVFIFYLFCSLFMLHLFCVGFFTYRTFFILYISSIRSLFMLQLFYVTFFPFWTFTFVL